jgi:hypothetical protein
MNKKGFELSINFIVVLILSIAVFSGGLIFAKKIFSEAQQIKYELDKQTEENLESLLDSGARFDISTRSKETEPGKVAIFGVGIINVQNSPAIFSVDISCITAVGRDQRPLDSPTLTQCTDWVAATGLTSISLDRNQKKIIPIGILPPKGTPRGTYGFSVSVSTSAGDYDAPKIVYVTIT